MDDLELTSKQRRTLESLDLHYALAVQNEKGKLKPLIVEVLEKIGLDRTARAIEER